MNYLIVDDEEIILDGMEWTLRDVVGENATIFKALNPYKALDIARENTVDIMFCDVDMPGMDGLHLAREMHNVSQNTDIVFATGYAHYSLDAWKTEAKAFILKPVSEDDMRMVLDKIMESRKKTILKVRVPEEEQEEPDKRDIVAMCFGNFELTYKGRPIRFSRKKSKEMLAYLIDRRGAMITTDEIRSILWEEEDDKDEKKGYVRVLANDIRKGFETLGADDILINNQNGYGVDVSKISCDYYDYRAKKPNSERLFQGEYMSQYSWAENTLGRLLNRE